MPKQPEGLDEFLAAPVEPAEAPFDPSGATNSVGEPAGLDDFIGDELKQEEYGGLGQQAVTLAEGAASGATLGISTGIERALGVDPEDIRNRAEANPISHGVGEVAGLVGSAAIPGVGAAGVLERTGLAAAKHIGGEVITQAAVKGAVEGALFQGGSEVSKLFASDPNQTAETAITDIGLAGVMGGVFGGAFGAAAEGLKSIKPPRFISEMDAPKVESGDFLTAVEHSDDIAEPQKKGILEGLRELKTEAPEIEAAAKRLGAPVMEGMTSASNVVQKAEDSLINGAPTVSGLRRQALYNEGFEIAAKAVDNVIGAEGAHSKAELGNVMKDTIVKQLDEQGKPISAMYDKIKTVTESVPVERDLTQAMMQGLKDVRELKIAPSSAEGQMVKRVLSDAKNLKTVDDLKAYRATLNVSPTAASGEKRMAGILKGMIEDMEENAIERYAARMSKAPESGWLPGEFESLKAMRQTAKSEYKTFINKVQTLSEQLGKGRVYGLQDAKNFINDLTPEQITQRLFSKNNSEFLKFFAKEFPDQMKLMQTYQKGILRETSSRTGQFSPKMLFNQINKMEPEIQAQLFSKAELQTLKDAETYLRSFPKNFNPSGTSGMSAFREFFHSPTGAVIGNARDFALEKFIQGVGKAPELKNAAALGSATVKGWKTTTKAIKAVFDPAKDALPSNVIPLISKREKLSQLVEQYSKDPSRMYTMGDNNPVPEYGTAFAATSSRAIEYLNSLKPQSNPAAPLDAKMPANAAQKSTYNRALDIAQQPLVTMKFLKEGTLTGQDMITLRTIYPNLYVTLAQKLSSQMVEQVSKGETIPYSTKLGLSLFLGQPLDSTMTPAAIVAAQPVPKQDQAQQNAPKSSNSGLKKLAEGARTPSQASESDKLKD